MAEPVSQPNPSTLRILCVEDYEPAARLLRDALHRNGGILVDVVPTIAQALDRLAATRPARAGRAENAMRLAPYHAVLTDLHLPDGNGLDLLVHLRRRGLALPLLVLSGSNEADTEAQALRAGACAFIAKRGNYLDHLPAVLQAAAAAHCQK